MTESSSASESDQEIGNGIAKSASSSSSPSPAWRSLYTHSSRSHPNLPPGPALFPPFYNRPPIPLPPSPSLTSLLRPSSFSATTSRPTSPDSSEIEHGRATIDGGVSSSLGGGIGTEATTTATSTADVMAKSARTATTVPRASPKVPTYEYYGFALYLASSAAFLLYLLWAYLPSPFLHRLGLYYYPNRWWALAIPAWLVIAILYIYIALASYNTRYLTQPLWNIKNVVDEAANIALVDAGGNIIRPCRSRLVAEEITMERPGYEAGTKGKGSKQTMLDSKRPADDTNVQDATADRQEIGEQRPPSVDWTAKWSKGTDAVLDVPIGGVCEVLYGIK